MSNVILRKKIHNIESAMMEMPQVHIDTRHYFPDGLYVREITIPKGVLLTGKIHNADHINIISKGEISILTEEGIKRIKAPHTMVSRPGTKRIGYAHEETVWTTVHTNPENETNIEKLEERLNRSRYDEKELLTEQELLLLKGEI